MLSQYTQLVDSVILQLARRLDSNRVSQGRELTAGYYAQWRSDMMVFMFCALSSLKHIVATVHAHAHVTPQKTYL